MGHGEPAESTMLCALGTIREHGVGAGEGTGPLNCACARHRVCVRDGVCPRDGGGPSYGVVYRVCTERLLIDGYDSAVGWWTYG